MSSLHQLFADVNLSLNDSLETLIPGPDIEPVSLHQAIRWSLFAGGKRIRPAIVFAVGRTFGAADERLVKTAAAIEMIHTYSLIHDDLPSMDDDDLRRGKATCHVKFGEATAILAGDVLQTLAFKTVAEDATLSFETRTGLISLIAGASGTPDGMVAGQQLDLEGEGVDLSLEEIEVIHIRKTGALIAASAVAGAIIGNGTNDQIEVVRDFGEKLGLLFQITDDLLDVTQSTDVLGKTSGKDAASEKATYPGSYGVERTVEMARSLREAVASSLAKLNRDTRLLTELADLVLSRSR